VAGFWQYEEARAPAPLARQVAAFWQMSGRSPLESGATHRVLPDGCMDVVFVLGPVREVSFVGTMTTALSVRLTGELDGFGIRFRPGGAAPWLRIPADELTDSSLDMHDCPLRAPPSLIDALAATPSFAARVRLASEWLLKSDRPDPEQLSVYAAARIFAREKQTVSAAARDLGMSERTLQRTFQKSVGIAPVEYRSIARMRRLLVSLDAGVALADAAVDAGYYDQPHLDREFRKLVGCSPSEWLATRVGFIQDASVTVL
jgi:AraC-like DNA-binding protein